MGNTQSNEASIERRIARRLRGLRMERNWPLEELAKRSGVSRATLSRLENAEVSPAVSVLDRLCQAYGLPLSRLIYMVEDEFAPLVRPAEQPVLTDAELGFTRRSVSPPTRALAGEALECELAPGARIAYDGAARQGLEHHLLMLSGRLELTIDAQTYDLGPGDCLRYLLFGPSAFAASEAEGARYLLFIV